MIPVIPSIEYPAWSFRCSWLLQQLQWLMVA